MRWIIICVLFVFVLVSASNAAGNSSYDEYQPYCFRFTWLGPKYNNQSVFMQATCDDIIGEKGTVPCTLPLVVSENGKLPNTTWMWDKYRENVTDIACRLSPSDVCVKYTYIYNHAVENITYMCTKVTIENEGATRSNCYTELQNGREIEVCVCESSAGEMPCNAAGRTQPSSMSFGLATVGLIVLRTSVAMIWRRSFGNEYVCG